MGPGDVVADRFEVEHLAGSGGHGSVYAARDRQSGERIALKVLFGEDPERGLRFAREALLLCELAHPGIVRYVAHGYTPQDAPFLAMEWLEGESLSRRLARGGLTIAETVQLGQRVAEALDFAHRRGVVHRDLKPSNLFLPGADIRRAKLLDFGIARFAAGRQLTITGAMLGTPGYIAPEQARGQRDIDARADLFALGCVLFKCLTGRNTFEAEDAMAVLLKVVLEDAPRPSELRSDVPSELDDLVARMLQKSPADRPRDAAQVAAALAALGELPGGLPHADAADRQALGAHERRVMCLVLARVTSAWRGRAAAPAAKDLLPGRTIPAPPPSGDGPPPQPASGPFEIEDDLPTTTMTQLGIGNSPWDDPELRVLLVDLVARHQGRLDLLADGSLLVSFSAGGARARLGARSPVSTRLGSDRAPAGEAGTDQAARAARCALALREVCGEVPLALVAGHGIVPGRLPVGAVIERGVRLLAASTGSPADRAVRLDEVAAGLLDARFEVGGDGLGLYLRSERNAAEASRTLLGKPTPCVGRDRELATLGAFYDETSGEPVARCVLVTAAAGVGKSRLRYEFLKQLEERDDALVWMARGDSMSAGSPFAMLTQLIGRAAGLRDGEPAHVRQQKLRARVGRHLDGVALARVAQFLGELMGAPADVVHEPPLSNRSPSGPPSDDPAARAEAQVELRAARQDKMLMGDQMRRAWEDWVHAECSVQPLVLVLEDMHWGDLPTVKFVDAALRSSSGAPLLVLAFARPEVHEIFPKLWDERGLQEIRLGELTRRGSERLVREVLGDRVDDATVSKLAQRAAGNAFYLEELIRAVAEGKSAADALPETVLAMVEARLEALEPDARRLLRAASVFGQMFWQGGVTALLGGEQRALDVDEWLAVLVDREVLTLRPAGKFPGDPEYVFRHALVRDAAYAMLTDEDRALGHRLAGEWLERSGERDALLLAEHFERGGEATRAVGCYRRAVAQALEGNDLEGAISRAEMGIARGARGAVLGELRLRQAEAHRWRGQFADAEACATAALESLPRDSQLHHAALGEAVLAAGRLGHEQRLDELVQALRQVSDAEATGTYLITLAQAAGVLFFFGRHDLAAPLFSRVDTMQKSLAAARDPAVAAWIQRARAIRALQGGDPSEYLRLMESTAASFEAAGDLRSACGQRVNVGYAYMGIGAWRDAERALREALAAAQRMGLANVVATAQNNLGLALARRVEGASRAYLASISMSAGQLEVAEREARAAAEILTVAPPARAYALAVLAQVLLARGDSGAALPVAREAHALLDSLGSMEEGEVLVRLSLAEALRACGDEPGTRRVLVAAHAKLTARAEKILDAGYRASFLQRVPENARVLALAAELGVS
jgi:tetratricopeptide (TPR) repeat protein